MAINIFDPDQTSDLQRAVRFSWEQQADERDIRDTLRQIYRDRCEDHLFIRTNDDTYDDKSLIPLFVQYITGHLLSVAHQKPKYAVYAKTLQGRGFDKRISNFLNRYADFLDLAKVFRQTALDSAFGRAVIKVVDGIAPVGIYSPYAPRAYRINPDQLIVEQAADTIEEVSFIGDTYLVPLDEAMNHQGFSETAMTLTPWTDNSDADRNINVRTSDIYAEDMTRLVDIYLPSKGVIVTWPAMDDTFSEIGTEQPLQIRTTPINPYCVLDLLTLPDSVEDFSRLETLSPLNAAANDLLKKAVKQARLSKRNPLGKMGHEHDLDELMATPDNEPILLENPEMIDLYTLPSQDNGVLQLGSLGLNLFSQYGGNLSVALGQSPGASTARQTNALIGQISNEQSLDRARFEEFMSMVGKKLATLAFSNEALELEVMERVPGTKYSFNAGWAPPSMLPRPGTINDYQFEVVPLSGAYRPPTERLNQLQQASSFVMQWMLAKSQGVPINLEVVMEDAAEAFDLVPRLQEWFSGEEPSPKERAQQSYQSVMEHQPGGAQVNYNPGLPGGDNLSAPPEAVGGLRSASGV